MEVSAQTIARMMGIASATDLQLLEGRLDLLATKVSTLMMKVDKIMTGLKTVASAGDVGRLETQIAAVKSMVREAVEAIGTLRSGPSALSKDAAESQSRKLREGIRSSSES
jgi:ribosomal protein L10